MRAFDGIEAFVTVVEAGSFTAAAAALQTAKSSVSDAVRGLEDRLGVRLLDRTTRRVRPTEAGQKFYARCRRLLDDATSARAEAQAGGGVAAGRLRVAVPEAFSGRYLVPGLGAFLAAHPALDVELVEGVVVTRLVEAGFDLAIRAVDTPEPGLIVRRLATSRIVVVATPGYLAAYGVPARPEDVARYRCVGFAPLAWRDRWRLGGREIAVRPQLLTHSPESLRAAALAGLGLVALPDWMVADLVAAGRVARVLPDCETPASNVYAVYPANRHIPPKVRAFVDHVARELRARGLPP